MHPDDLDTLIAVLRARPADLVVSFGGADRERNDAPARVRVPCRVATLTGRFNDTWGPGYGWSRKNRAARIASLGMLSRLTEITLTYTPPV